MTARTISIALVLSLGVLTQSCTGPRSCTPTSNRVAPSADPPAKRIATADSGACLVRPDGKVVCSGFLYLYPYVPPFLDGSEEMDTPRVLNGIGPAKSVACDGEDGCCVLERDGEVYCWGYATLSPYGGEVINPVPSRIEGLDDAVDIAVGDGFACALRRTGEVSCWGHDPARSRIDWQQRFFAIEGFPETMALEAHYHQICALDRRGKVRCYGD
ncbi:MAG: hypothetical protein H5U40_09560, partial [Polyangiaceae bacterium]|nr:hypothetical protein [Polyangiaceae bacterium]